jgi:hypothetical protein
LAILLLQIRFRFGSVGGWYTGRCRIRQRDLRSELCLRMVTLCCRSRRGGSLCRWRRFRLRIPWECSYVQL